MEANEESDAENAPEDVDIARTTEEIAEPPTKKSCGKVETLREAIKGGDVQSSSTRLEQRLATVLCCTLCLDLPVRAVYQVS